MKTAEIEEFLPETSGFEALLAGGQSVQLTLHGHAVALLTPLPPVLPANRVRWPDFAARQHEIFGTGLLPPGTIQALINEERGA